MPETATHQMIMAFDFGTQKTGMAVGQALIESANPLPLFPMKDGIPNWDNLLKIVKQYQPDLFIIGLPLNMDDSESELSTRARKFARRLRHQTNIETLMVDERLTTREARDELGHYQAQGRGKNISADSIAAALFIESWYRNPVGVKP
ncbi:Holliday junction resolvase RuvX [Acinetobacter gandensis]|uniref:Putative pre-16S rRNA nuclease n=1 Tax=Acinetobacter gandensis TaxID=1443941 RepID=A0A1A7RAA4_9GAMM|nr:MULTISPECIES: Holliday junction resolvase RuvX [Acinetobacter]KAB0629242.1 Holliday junction resolvase RuvX [Acinetobacter gandensis]OBX29190.1 Holliday junction DNA helicase RuvA [Acinetobacter gandensis]